MAPVGAEFRMSCFFNILMIKCTVKPLKVDLTHFIKQFACTDLSKK